MCLRRADSATLSNLAMACSMASSVDAELVLPQRCRKLKSGVIFLLERASSEKQQRDQPCICTCQSILTMLWGSRCRIMRTADALPPVNFSLVGANSLKDLITAVMSASAVAPRDSKEETQVHTEGAFRIAPLTPI